MARSILLISTAIAALAACQTTAAPQRHIVETREARVDGINPAAIAIWEVMNGAAAEGGELDLTRMEDDDWAQLRESARMLEDYSRMLAGADGYVAGGPNLVGSEIPEGVATRAEIQAMIDSDPEGFRAVSRDLAERSRLLLVAAQKRDPAAGHRAAEIDRPCQSCHNRYWYKQDRRGAPEWVTIRPQLIIGPKSLTQGASL